MAASRSSFNIHAFEKTPEVVPEGVSDAQFMGGCGRHVHTESAGLDHLSACNPERFDIIVTLWIHDVPPRWSDLA